jgi:hypothetical protein
VRIAAGVKLGVTTPHPTSLARAAFLLVDNGDETTLRLRSLDRRLSVSRSSSSLSPSHVTPPPMRRQHARRARLRSTVYREGTTCRRCATTCSRTIARAPTRVSPALVDLRKV